MPWLLGKARSMLMMMFVILLETVYHVQVYLTLNKPSVIAAFDSIGDGLVTAVLPK